ncbi:MAG: hypothetical protein AB1505_30720 [Candidatus Latescibacterota bacterium]
MLVNLLAFAESQLVGQSGLDQAYVYGGRGIDLKGGARAEASAMAGVSSRQVRAGLEVGVDLGAEGHATVNWVEYPQQGEGSVQLGATGEGRARVHAEAGLIVTPPAADTLGAALFAGLGGSGLVGIQAETFFAGGDLRRLEVTTRKQGRWGYDVGAESLYGGVEGPARLD